MQPHFKDWVEISEILGHAIKKKKTLALCCHMQPHKYRMPYSAIPCAPSPSSVYICTYVTKAGT